MLEFCASRTLRLLHLSRYYPARWRKYLEGSRGAEQVGRLPKRPSIQVTYQCAPESLTAPELMPVVPQPTGVGWDDRADVLYDLPIETTSLARVLLSTYGRETEYLVRIGREAEACCLSS
jgi:hypothetical protein